MKPHEVAQYRGQRVVLRFSNGAQARAQIISVDPDVHQHHVFYDVLEVLETGSSSEPSIRAGEAFACSAEAILELRPTDGKVYRTTPSRSWWKFW